MKTALSRYEVRPREAAPKGSIRIRALRKAYKTYDQRLDFLKEAMTGGRYHREKEVLRDINLTIAPGEVVGIIGRNGAGKSTLLKMIAGTLAPSAGTIEVEGRASAILELGTGFNPAYSGRENVMMSALMRGLSEVEIARRFDDIVDFAGLSDVIDEPFQNYSSGMQARLAFAAAIAVDADVLIIDEALAAGDIRFAARCIKRIHEICQSGVTALFVSHVTYHVMQLCSRAIWIDGGRIRMDGPPVEVVRAYEHEMHEEVARDLGRMRQAGATASTPPVAPQSSQEPQLQAQAGVPALEAVPVSLSADDIAALPALEATTSSLAGGAAVSDLERADTRAARRHFNSGQYQINAIAFRDADGHEVTSIRFGETLTIIVDYECLLPELPRLSCGLAVAFNRQSDFEAVMYFNTNYPHSDGEMANYDHMQFRRYIGRRGRITSRISPVQLKPGSYYVSMGLLPNQPGPHEFYEYRHCHFILTVLPNGFEEPAVFYPMVEWRNDPWPE